MDPLTVLGVSADASEDEIRAAYLRKLREHPPDRSPEAFEQIRDAYAVLSDARRRIQHRLFGIDPRAPLADVFAEPAPSRRFVGPGPWREALKPEAAKQK